MLSALQLPNDQEWKRQAGCLGLDPNLFFADQHAGPSSGREAKAICATCPVRSECLEYGLDERFGIWGGLSERERRIERRQRRLNATSNTTSPEQPSLVTTQKGK